MTHTAAQPSAQPPPNLVTVADVMRPPPTTADTNDHAAAAAYLMKHAGASALMVLDAVTGQPTGILTEANIARAVADGKDLNDLPIRKLMTIRPTVINPATSVRAAAQIMIRGHFRHLPVSGDSGLVGIIDITDICSAAAPTGRASSPRKRPRSPGWPGRACLTRRSPPSCSLARARSSTTWERSSPSSASPPAANSGKRCPTAATTGRWHNPDARTGLGRRVCHPPPLPRWIAARARTPPDCASHLSGFERGTARMMMPQQVLQRSIVSIASVEGQGRMTMVDEQLADTTHTYAAHAMLALHAMFRREFGLMPDLVRAVAAGDTQRAALVADHIALVSDVVNLYYSREDRHIWPRLRERCPEQCAPLADVLDGPHRAVQTSLLQMKEAAESWRDGASTPTRGVLADSVDRLIQVTAEHLALVEERVVPIVEKNITEAEYGVKVREHAARIPRDKLPAVFGMVTYGGDPVVIGMFVAEMPIEVQSVIMDISVKAYAAYADELYGTATPPSVTG